MKKAKDSTALDEGKFTTAFDAWLAAWPKAAPTLKSFIASMKPKLIEARRKGVTYEQLTAFLREQGVECSISTLKAYLAVRRRPKPGGKIVKNRQTSGAKPAAQPANVLPKVNESGSNPPDVSRTQPDNTEHPGIKGNLPPEDY